jgi:hypothetical protein
VFAYYKWMAKGPDLITAKARRLQQSQSPRAAYWIFEMSGLYRPSDRISADRILIAITFNHKGQAIIKDQSRWIRFPQPEFQGEAQHPNEIIVKSNEPGAYGIGRSLLEALNTTACVNEVRLAGLEEVARAFGKKTWQVQDRMRLQRWE